MLKKLEERRQVLVRERKEKGLGFLGREALLKVVPGSNPKTTKKITRDSKRPLVLTKCPIDTGLSPVFRSGSEDM